MNIQLYLVEDFRMRGAASQLLILWCIGTGKFEVLRHDVDEYRSVSAQWRTEGGTGVWGVQPPPTPKFRSFDKAAFDCNLS